MQSKLLLPALLLLNTFLYAGKLPGVVPGKILFSGTPFTGSSTASKTSFISSEYIYGRLEISGSSIKEAFKLRDLKGYPFLVCDVSIMQNGEDLYGGFSGNNYILLKEEDKSAGSFNFDIMPDPSKATTLYSMLDDFSAGNGFSPLSSRIIGMRMKEGKYQVQIKIYSRAVDGWGKEQDRDKWPVLEGQFDYEFMESDIEKVKNDSKKTGDVTRENAFSYDKLPAVFSNPGKLTDPNATTAKVAAILKRDLPERAILKFVAEQYSGTQWSIAKDDYGLPRYKYFNPHIWMAYKADGKCYVGYVTLRQVYSGGGTYGPLEVAWTSTKDDRAIDCGKVK